MNIFKLLKKKPTVKEDDFNPNFGNGFIAKELVDGSWVLMKGNQACDLKYFGFMWSIGSSYWHDCIGTQEFIQANAKHIMAKLGVFKQ